jgi:hypothetical protein
VNKRLATSIQEEQPGAGTLVERNLETHLSASIRKHQDGTVVLIRISANSASRNAVLIHEHQGSRRDNLRISGSRCGPHNVHSLKTGSEKPARDCEDHTS